MGLTIIYFTVREGLFLINKEFQGIYSLINSLTYFVKLWDIISKEKVELNMPMVEFAQLHIPTCWSLTLEMLRNEYKYREILNAIARSIPENHTEVHDSI